jgi:hypothetical protein
MNSWSWGELKLRAGVVGGIGLRERFEGTCYGSGGGDRNLTEKRMSLNSEVNLAMNILPLFSGECAAVDWE